MATSTSRQTVPPETRGRRFPKSRATMTGTPVRQEARMTLERMNTDHPPGGGCSGSTSSPTPTPAPSGATCTQYTSSSQIPQGFGVPWDVTNPSVMLVSANCTPPTLLLKAEDPSTTKTVYVYKTGYVAPSGASSWSPVDLFGSQLLSGAWYPSSAQGVTKIPDQTKATFYVAYTCQWTGTSWKCGCRDSACMQSYWQLQKIQQ